MRYELLSAGSPDGKRFDRLTLGRGDGVPETLQCGGLIVFPGFTDVHTHFREPGFSYKETIKTGALAGAAGGFVRVCTMPNVSPVPDCLPALRAQTDLIQRDAVIFVHPFASITKGEEGKALSDIEALAPFVPGFSDDGRGVQDASLMQEAMQRARAVHRPIVAHCEDTSFAPEDAKSEWKEVERDIELAMETGAALHICHVSCKESVKLIRAGKKSGADLTFETAPHYLLLNRAMRLDDGRFKMNPPLREKADQDALLEALFDGTLDMIATDHAPHSAEEKALGFAHSLNGIVGLETVFPVLYTGLVKKGGLPVERLIDLMCFAPNRRFGFVQPETTGEKASCAVFDMETPFLINANAFQSKGRSTPFDGYPVYGRCVYTFVDGKLVYRREQP